ncbi:MAG: hypothetical protein QME96_14650 [Myxococcota bacterium]|nr:hypothetical protein [Myxococcota bacterium]
MPDDGRVVGAFVSRGNGPVELRNMEFLPYADGIGTTAARDSDDADGIAYGTCAALKTATPGLRCEPPGVPPWIPPLPRPTWCFP